ncbi:MAG: hypothetical protein RLZZ200_2413 [Pseudomonadota bacterium]
MSGSTGVRVGSAVVLGAALIGVLFFAPQSWTVALIVAVLLGGAWEWSGFLRVRSPLTRVMYVLLTGLWFVAASALAFRFEKLDLLLGLSGLWWLWALGWIVRGPASSGRWSAAVSGWLVLVPACVALLWIWVDPSYGLNWILYVLFLVWAADTGAYFAGRALGRRKLAPRVSPGKTWEGAAGGLLLVAVLSLLAAPVLGAQRPVLLGVSIVVGVFSIVGDLTESLFKRHAGLKDSGRLIPGHGGLLDRVDSIMAAAPLLLLATRCLP